MRPRTAITTYFTMTWRILIWLGVPYHYDLASFTTTTWSPLLLWTWHTLAWHTITMTRSTKLCPAYYTKIWRTFSLRPGVHLLIYLTPYRALKRTSVLATFTRPGVFFSDLTCYHCDLGHCMLWRPLLLWLGVFPYLTTLMLWLGKLFYDLAYFNYCSGVLDRYELAYFDCSGVLDCYDLAYFDYCSGIFDRYDLFWCTQTIWSGVL